MKNYITDFVHYSQELLTPLVAKVPTSIASMISVAASLTFASSAPAQNYTPNTATPFLPTTNPANAGTNLPAPITPYVDMQRTGEKDEVGLENIKLRVIDSGGRTLYQGIVHSGIPSTQDNFSYAGSTKSGRNIPAEYGHYKILPAKRGQGSGVGDVFIPLVLTKRTKRAAVGFHLDANFGRSPGSAGCVVWRDENEFNKFRIALKHSGAQQLIFLSGIMPQSNISSSPPASKQSATWQPAATTSRLALPLQQPILALPLKPTTPTRLSPTINQTTPEHDY